MKYLKEKIIAFVFFALSLFFLNASGITEEMILYAVTMNYADISLGNLALFALFFSCFIAMIASSSIVRVDKKNRIFIGGLVFIGLFALTGARIPVLSALLFSLLIGLCFYLFMRKISKEVDEFKHVNYMRAFMIIKANTHKCFFLISFLFAVLVAFLAVDLSGMEVFEKTGLDIENTSVELDSVVDMAMEIQKQSTFQTADMTRLLIIESVYNDALLSDGEKITCLDSINRSDAHVREKIEQSYSDLDLEEQDLDLQNTGELKMQNNQNSIFEQADFLITVVKDYYFLIAGFVMFFIASFCGSVIALVSSLIAVMLLRVTGSLDGQKKNAS